MSQNAENGFFAMIERLWRAVVALYWVAVMVLLPLVAVRGLFVAYRRKRAATDKHERRYWRNEILFNWCLMYGVVVIYYHLFQDILFLPFSFQAQARFTAYFDTIMGLPAAIWYGASGQHGAFGDDPMALLTPTFFGVFIVFLCSFALSWLRVFGHVDEAGDWIAPDRVNRERIAQFEREEAPSRALSKQWYMHKMQHPSNHPAWDEMPEETRRKLIEKWEAEKADLWRKIEECPRASYFSRSK
ncbi:TPA: hypothetical protein QDA83_005719 [Burkholderia multivorans]|uniref:hypothetical protein n=1 Tax=Burkholderia cepacia complex TaxID=87882 RepID=UPI0011CA58FE|nr:MULTISPECIES: hypothetical protein [Burkholderia cepacia complex]MBU9305610.1 hypothetical protein [Burkholderia multivorans]MBU9408239.1 hypothetical protein [Burkholderia multivorans]MCA8462434.1 hypothetical protein [Burkholderia multivorans]MDN8017358.1 hypothetical protein [Burkholderia multivorans]MDN8054549.1 hypothetical protein [Burkholderia multivorans]